MAIQPGTTTSATPPSVWAGRPKTVSKGLWRAVKPKPTVTKTTTTTREPNAQWWNQQFRADPRYMMQSPQLAASENTAAWKYGYYIPRSNGRTTFKSSSTGVTGITQVVDAQGVPLLDNNGNYQYKDASGKTYSAGDLQLDVRAIAPGEAGYLGGELGAAAAGSQRKQYGIGDIAARSGAGRSGMRASESSAESQRLQAELGNIARSAAGELGAIAGQRQGLYSTIYSDLMKNPEIMPSKTETTTTSKKPKLSGGKSGAFVGLFERVVSRKDAPYPQTVRLLNLMKKNYALSKNQIRWIDNWIKNNKPKA